jgi:signal transduction histidine kinase
MAMPTSPEERAAYFDYGEADRALLAELRSTFEKEADSLVAAFYRHLLSYPSTRHLLRDPAAKDRLLVLQRRYLESLAGPTIDEAYLAHRRRVGEVHERIGLEPHWYLGGYALYLTLLTPLVCERFATEPHRGERALVALQKLLLLDASLAMETYIERGQRELEYLNQELSRSGRELAHDLEAQGAKLRQTAERARAAEQLASLGTLVAGLAHEIGTPMGVIQGHAKLLENKVTDDQARWRLQTIQEQIARIAKIMQSLLNMARPTRSARGPVALAPLLENTAAFLREKFQRRGVRVESRFEPVPSVRGDAERLQQLFLNLFLNAVDAMPEGGELRVSLRARGDEVEIEVADSGEGIAEEDLPRLFDPFFTTKPAGEGSGLGLSVARSIVTDHGGEIDVRSGVGQGTTFRIVLPAARASGEPARAGA